MSERIVLVRHGETDINAKGKTHNYEDNEVLNDTGVEQMIKVARRLKGFMPLFLYCSTEERANHSAEIISKELGIFVETIEGMQERNWGEMPGKPWPEIKSVLDTMTMDERRKFVPEGGESWVQFEKRLIAGVEWVLKENPDQTIVIVTHGGVITVLMPYLLNGGFEEALKPEHMFGNASVTVFGHNKDRFTQALINDTSHLK